MTRCSLPGAGPGAGAEAGIRLLPAVAPWDIVELASWIRGWDSLRVVQCSRLPAGLRGHRGWLVPRLAAMKLTKFTHACVRLEKDGRVLVFDPGTFSETDQALAGADAVLITHEHGDHVDVDAVAAALQANTALELFAPEAVAGTLRGKAPDAGSRIHTAAAGEELRGRGLLDPDLRRPARPHPPADSGGRATSGTSWTRTSTTRAIPSRSRTASTSRRCLSRFTRPWNKVGEVVDFVIGVRAPLAFPIHDALLNDNGPRPR